MPNFPLWLKETPDGIVLSLRIIPRANKNAVQGELGDALKIRLCAPPVEGAANSALVAFLAKRLDMPRSNVMILSGATARNKHVLVKGLSSASVIQKLAADL